VPNSCSESDPRSSEHRLKDFRQGETMGLWHTTATLALAAAISSCSDIAGQHFTRYELVDIDGVALPKTFVDEEGQSVISAGTLYLSNNGTGLRVEAFTRHPQVGLALQGWTREPREYRVANDSISFGSFEPCTASCSANDIGRFSKDELTLSYAGQGPVYRYVRSSPF
jgi:hypothetical protein